MSKKIIALLLVLILMIPNFTFAVSTKSIQSNETQLDFDFFIEVFQYIKDRYPFDTENNDLIEGALKGMLQSLDPFSDYYNPEEASELYQDMLGLYSGIGVYIEENDSYINIKDIIKDSPAEKVGLKKDDKIISIDGVSTEGLSLVDASKLIKGPVNSKVKLEIIRNESKFLIKIEIIRATIIIKSVEYKVLENDIGYIKLSDFSKDVALEMKTALDDFDKKGITKIILDVRNNPGGLLNQVIEISRPFIPAGPIVHIKEKNQELLTHISTTKKLKYKLVLLVNENSASASEILAGAIKDTKSGTLIGKKTFGKGVVQSLIPLDNDGILKMTIAQYLTPNKKSIHLIGVEPDIIIENKLNVDEQLKEAIKILK